MKSDKIMQVLLVDDDALDRELFADAILKTGIKVRLAEASDGAECLRLLQQGAYKPDIIFPGPQYAYTRRPPDPAANQVRQEFEVDHRCYLVDLQRRL